jgi:hypothetical protein
MRHSVNGQKAGSWRVKTDTLQSTGSVFADAYQYRLTLVSGEAGRTPRVGAVYVTASNSYRHGESLVEPHRLLWGEGLDVPPRSQMVYENGGEVWCNPTSLSMVMAYWAKKTGKRSLDQGNRGWRAAPTITPTAATATGPSTRSTPPPTASKPPSTASPPSARRSSGPRRSPRDRQHLLGTWRPDGRVHPGKFGAPARDPGFHQIRGRHRQRPRGGQQLGPQASLPARRVSQSVVRERLGRRRLPRAPRRLAHTRTYPGPRELVEEGYKWQVYFVKPETCSP